PIAPAFLNKNQNLCAQILLHASGDSGIAQASRQLAILSGQDIGLRIQASLHISRDDRDVVLSDITRKHPPQFVALGAGGWLNRFRRAFDEFTPSVLQDCLEANPSADEMMAIIAIDKSLHLEGGSPVVESLLNR
ncbi:MAG: hypothetical protein ACI841_004793, partial [Planctomycetota bacterium]